MNIEYPELLERQEVLIEAALQWWERATKDVIKVFIDKYFDGEADYFRVSDEVGGVLAVNDYFFSLDRIIEALRLNASVKDFFEFYDLELEAVMSGKKIGINFRNFLRR